MLHLVINYVTVTMRHSWLFAVLDYNHQADVLLDPAQRCNSKYMYSMQLSLEASALNHPVETPSVLCHTLSHHKVYKLLYMEPTFKMLTLDKANGPISACTCSTGPVICQDNSLNKSQIGLGFRQRGNLIIILSIFVLWKMIRV